MEDGFLGMGSGGAGGGMGHGVNGRGQHSGGSNMGDGGGGAGVGMKGTGSESAAFLSGLVRQNLSVMLKAMRKMQGYWAGISYIMSVSDLIFSCSGATSLESWALTFACRRPFKGFGAARFWSRLEQDRLFDHVRQGEHVYLVTGCGAVEEDRREWDV